MYMCVCVCIYVYISEMASDRRGTELKRKLVDTGSDSDNEIESECV